MCHFQLACKAKKEEDYEKRLVTEGKKAGQHKALMKVLRQNQELFDILDGIFGDCASTEPMQTRDVGKQPESSPRPKSIFSVYLKLLDGDPGPVA